jgi:hypothetical protein
LKAINFSDVICVTPQRSAYGLTHCYRLEEVIMGNWKVLFLGAALGSALTVAIVHYNPNTFGSVGAAALAAHETNSHQRISAINDPVAASENARSTEGSENEPWGPFRTVDW